MSTCDLKTLGSRPIVPKNLPGHSSLSEGRFSCSFKCHIFSLLMLTIDLIMLTDFEHVVQSLAKTHIFSVSILRSSSNHMPLKGRCPDYCYVGIRHFYLVDIYPHTETKRTYCSGAATCRRNWWVPIQFYLTLNLSSITNVVMVRMISP